MTIITKGMGAIIKGLKTPEKVAGKILRTAKKEKKGVLLGIGAAAITDALLEAKKKDKEKSAAITKALLEAQNKKKDKKKSKDK